MSKSRKAETKPESPTAMDPSVREQASPEASRPRERDAYAITTLINEVTGLFPEVDYETGGTNAFNTRLVVSFDTTALANDDAISLYQLLSLVQSDVRVLGVSDMLDRVAVEFHNSLRTQDSRAPFGLAEAHAILSSGEGDLALDENHDFVIATEGDKETDG